MFDLGFGGRPAIARWPRSLPSGTGEASRPSLREYTERYRNMPSASGICCRACGDGAARLSRGAGDGQLRRDVGRPGPRSAAARRIPHPSPGGTRRNGNRLRSSAGISRPARGTQGPSDGRADVCDPPRAIPPRGAGGGAAAPYQYRAGVRRWRARGRALLRHAVHPGPGTGSRAARAGAPSSPGRSSGRRRHSTPRGTEHWHRPRPA